MKNFWSSLQGKIVGRLIVLAILMGIYAEAILAYKNTEEAKTARAIAENAAKLKLAEAEERLQLAKKAAADAETAGQIAIYAAKQKAAEAEEKTQLAKKAAADAEKAIEDAKTAGAVADVSHEMQAATLAAKQAEARKLDGEAVQQQTIACAMDSSKCNPEQRCITEGITGVGKRLWTLGVAASDRLSGDEDSVLSGIGYNKACLHLKNEGQPDPSQIPPNCRENYAFWHCCPAILLKA